MQMTDKKKNTEAESLDAASIVEQTTVADIFRAAYYLDNVAV